MLPYLKGHKVFGYVDGIMHQPVKTIITSDGFMCPNQSYTN